MPESKEDSVKVAIKPIGNQNTMFITLDQSVPLKTVMSDLCKSWSISDPPDQYALQFSDDDVSKNDSRTIVKNGDGRYVTEKNRTEIRNGSILQFSYSPSRITNDILEVLTKKSKDQMKSSLQQLVRLSADPAFTAEFIQKNGRRILSEALEQRNIKPDDGLGSALEAFNKMMDFEAWDKPSHKFISVIANEVNQPEDSTASDPKILMNALSILESAATSCQSLYSVVESELSLSKLINHVQRQTGQPEIQQNAIALINALLLKADLPKRKSMINTLSNQRFRSIITSCILDMKQGTPVGYEMAHQLHALQSALFSTYDEDINCTAKEKIDEGLNELRKLAFEGEYGASSDALNRSRASNVGSVASSSFHSLQDDYQKLGFSNCKNPIDDFSEFPRLLSLNLMLYFARNYTEHFVKFVLENCCRVDRDHECPFVRSSIELTKLICDLLKLTTAPSDEGNLFYSMFFTHEHPLEEFFVISLLTLSKTWKEMRATTEDFGKVFSVLQQQLSRSLKDRDATINFEKFKNNLYRLNYAEIMKLWQEERNSREEWENKAQAILELREVVKPSIILLIQRQRLRFLTEGTQFVKYSPKGQRVKDKFWFCRLSHNHKYLHYGDCDENRVPTIDDLPHRLAIADVKHLLLRKDCPHMRDSKSKKSTSDTAFSLIPKSEQDEPLNFVAANDKTFDYWTDGLNALLNQPMDSRELASDLKALLTMNIKLRLLDTEGVDIPDTPPQVPPLPSHYNFAHSY